MSTPRNKIPVRPAWVESTTKKVISESAGVKQDAPKSYVKDIQYEVAQLTKDRVYVPVKKPPVIVGSVKAG